MIGMRMAPPLLCVLAMSACAEIDFGVSAGGGGAGAGGGGASTGGGASEGGGSAGAENCVNGLDDDDDNLVDCADSDCSAFACVAVPEGWGGPVELRPEETTCNGAFSVEVLTLKSSVVVESATCACNCAGGTPACDSVTASFYGSGECNGGASTQTLGNSLCETLDRVAGADSYLVHGVPPGLQCAVGVETAVPTPAFVSQRLCGPPTGGGGGCDEGSCAPTGQVCVYAPGSVACPAGFESPLVLFNDFVDSRSCLAGSCACAAPTGGCVATLALFDNLNCVGGVISTALTDICTNFNFGGGPSYSAAVDVTPGAYSCTESGAGAPTGSVTLNAPTTVCCTP